jgi:hypothetical protein
MGRPFDPTRDVKVVITTRILADTSRGVTGSRSAQLVGSVYVNGREFQVMAPWNATGNTVDWLAHCDVYTTDRFIPSETETNDAIEAIRAKLSKSVSGLQTEAATSSPAMANYYHLRLRVGPDIIVKHDLQLQELQERILTPYGDGQPIVITGRSIPIAALKRIEIFTTPHPFSEISSGWAAWHFGLGIEDWSAGEPNIKNVTDEMITGPAGTSNVSRIDDMVDLLCQRFPRIALQLLERYEGRETLRIADEYDVQDLLRALLRMFFDDVRSEEPSPSVAGKASRMDFVLVAEDTVIEVKKTRPTLRDKEVGGQIIEDITRYRKHPNCKRLIFFVYDPDNLIANPRGIEADLTKNENGLEVKVIISSQR